MRNIYHLLSFFLSIYFTQAVYAQEAGVITGTIKDEKGAALGFATVAVVQTSNAVIVTGTVTEANGNFRIKTPTANTYLLRITALGYVAHETPVFEVTNGAFSKDFGSIVLKEDAKQLKEVKIQALRPTITQEADKLVVSVEGTAMAAGSTAFDVLVKSPGVFIDQDGNIQLNGKNGVTVMLDGKLTYLSARDLKNMLEGMSAENIKNIEIITNPSAKYDAEGTSGILNINLKKNTQSGMNGSIYGGSTYNFFKQVGFTTGANINYKTGRWNSFLILNAARRVGGREATFTRIFYAPSKTTYFDQVATGNFVNTGPPAIRFGSDFIIDDRHSIGFVQNFTRNTGISDFLTDTYIGNSPDNPNQFIDADNIRRNTYSNFTTNLHYIGKFNKAGTQLTSDLDYARITNRGESDFFNYYTNLTTNQVAQDILYTSTPNNFDIYSAKVDFTHPFTKDQKFETGVKASKVTSDNDSRFYFNNNSLQIDLLRTNHFKYRENIYAAYLNWSGKLSDRVTGQAGLRAENTQSLGKSLTTGEKNDRHYLNFFPSLFLQQKLHENYGINYSYSRRLTRPNYGSLNPFRFYRDPNTFEQGNPELRPQYTQSFSLTQNFKKHYVLTTSYNYNRDVMAEIPILDVLNATTIYTTGNVDNSYSLGMTGVAPVKIAKWWDSNNTVVLSYNKFNYTIGDGQIVNDQLFYMAQSNQTMLLPKDFRLELNLLYRGPAASGLYHMAPMHRVDLALKKSFFEQKFEVTLNANDIFKGNRFYWTTDINGNVNEFDQYFRWRSVGFSLRYNFSRGQKVDTKRRNNTLEELNRT